MLINLRVDNPNVMNNRIPFDLPPMSFHDGQLVAVSQIHIKWESQQKHALITLSSTLIDKSSYNPHQQLLLVYEKNNNFNLHRTPTRREYYKIQCMELQSSEFYLFNYDKRKIAKIESIFLQLEILDERIQSITQKKK